MKNKITGLKQDSTFGGAIHQSLYINNLRKDQREEVRKDIAKALAPIVIKYAKCEVRLRISDILRCEKGHQYSDDETYCIHCNLENQGRTADKWRKNKSKKGE